MKKEIFNGVGTAIVTPFKNGEVDYATFENLIKRQVLAGVKAIIVLGTTGEPASITTNEREKIIRLTRKTCSGDVKMIVGCGSNSTHHAIQLYNQAERLGADGALIVTPYYNKCTQSGLIEHYSAISNSGNLPIIAYNVPSRTGVNISPETMLEIAKIKNVCGLKEASGNIAQIVQTFKLLRGKLAIYSGEDSLNAVFLALGASGTISVLSNVLPKAVVKVDELAKMKNFEDMFKMQEELLDVTNSLFLEVNPIPAKAALWHLGLCKNELRLPLTKMSKEKFEILKNALIEFAGKDYDCL